MLAITVRKQERVMVGPNVQMHVKEVRPDGRITLAFDAPKSVHIERFARFFQRQRYQSQKGNGQP